MVDTYMICMAREVCDNKGNTFTSRPEVYRFTQNATDGHLLLLGYVTKDGKLTRHLMVKYHLTRTVRTINQTDLLLLRV